MFFYTTHIIDVAALSATRRTDAFGATAGLCVEGPSDAGNAQASWLRAGKGIGLIGGVTP